MRKSTVILLLIVIAFAAYKTGYLPEDIAVLFDTSAGDSVEPFSDGTCPNSHPVKASFPTPDGGICIYHVKGQISYDKTRPVRCYATEGEAKHDGCTKATDAGF